MNIFEEATRKQLRFSSPRGELTVEQLWVLPLTGKTADLDSVARTIDTELRSLSEQSFVSTAVDPRKPILELKLEIVKHIIAVKLREAEEAKTYAMKKQRRQEILEILAAKKTERLITLSEEELLLELEKVS